MQDLVQISTHTHKGLCDINPQVETIVTKSGIQTGMINSYVRGATAAIMIDILYDRPPFNECRGDPERITAFIRYRRNGSVINYQC